MEIIPSLVEQTPQELFSVLRRLSSFYSRFQVDIEDGVYIQNKTLSTAQIASYVETNPSGVSRAIHYDFHLMVERFEKDLEILASLAVTIPIDTILLHASLRPPLAKLRALYPNFRIGLVLNPDDDIVPILSNYDLKSLPIIQIMSVYPGKQGQSFIKDSLNIIDQLRNLSYNNKIYLDGAVNEQTLPFIMQRICKPDALCPGSYLTKASDDLTRRVALLKELTA